MEIYLTKDLLATMMADLADGAKLLAEHGHDQNAKDLRAARIIIGSMWESCDDDPPSGLTGQNVLN